MNFNKAILVGRLTKDPESRALPSGQNVVSFGLATNRVWKNQAGEKQEMVEFHNTVAFGKLADICSRYLKRGQLILVEGRIQTRSWQGQDNIKKYRTEIVIENMQMGPKAGGAAMSTQTSEKPQEDIPIVEEDDVPQAEEEINVKDIPF